MASSDRVEMFWGTNMSTAAAFCLLDSRKRSTEKSDSFMITQRRVKLESSGERASATTMAPWQPGNEIQDSFRNSHSNNNKRSKKMY